MERREPPLIPDVPVPPGLSQLHHSPGPPAGLSGAGVEREGGATGSWIQKKELNQRIPRSGLDAAAALMVT